METKRDWYERSVAMSENFDKLADLVSEVLAKLKERKEDESSIQRGRSN